MKSKLGVAALAAVSIMMFSACSKSTTDGTPTPATGRGTTAQTTSSSGDKQPTGNDLDITRYADKPCDLIKPDQLATLGNLKPGEPGKGPLGPTCTWSAQNPTRDNTYALSLVTRGNTLESMIENVKDDPVFKTTTVAGRDAYSTDNTDGTLDCGTGVKTSSKDAIFAQVTLGVEDTAKTGKSCQASERLAAIIIGNLGG
ncbi:hypothetical protein GCM10022243_46150 [Saccharothrix violaceirubra]|uniref:DUF3558 domain-containing protein n=1 Tax=Saccharothrix violaceirubra TaxID=413306 RepID=A0A7W7T0W5_9PSEU|nr:DUF3558 domain-containing protein [Saccharothrix violaceirubra]MBB4964495.1 hypothetical protein [Saccharothrix violaceirubra]